MFFLCEANNFIDSFTWSNKVKNGTSKEKEKKTPRDWLKEGNVKWVCQEQFILENSNAANASILFTQSSPADSDSKKIDKNKNIFTKISIANFQF